MPPTAQDLSLLIHPLVPESIVHNTKVRAHSLQILPPAQPILPFQVAPHTDTVIYSRPSPTSVPYPHSCSASPRASSASSPRTASSSTYSACRSSRCSSTSCSRRASRGDTSRVAVGVIPRVGRTVGRGVVVRVRGGMCGLVEGC